MANHEDIKAFLQRLDPKNEDLFTGQNLVKMDIVKAQFGEDVTREDVTAAWPEFDRAAIGQGGNSQEQDPNPNDEALTEPTGKSDVQRINDELAELEKQQHALAQALKDKQAEAMKAIEAEQAVGQMHQADQVRLLAQETRRMEQEGFKEDLKKLMEKIK